MKRFTTFLLLLVLALTLAALSGCGSSEASNTPADAPAEAEDTEIIIGALSTPHAEILELVRGALEEQGYTLDIVIYDDYVLPNTALADGTVAANYFQHVPYLDSFNAANGTDLVSAGAIHYEPYGLYGNGISDLSELADGATIIIPADDSNETRALLLLQQAGLITLPEEASALTGVTTLDILDDGGFDIQTVQADTVPAQLKNSDPGTVAIINGNYALAAGLHITDALAVEDASGDAAQTYGNIIAVRRGDENSAKIQALVKTLQTEEVRDFIESSYNGAVLPVF